MLAGQTLRAADGYEVALFPMPYLYMSQDEGGDYSHVGTYNIDLLGYGPTGRILQAPLYAPCTMKLVAYENTYAGGHMCTFESVDRVHLANGQLDYLTIGMAHAQYPPYTTLGDIVNQGQQCYSTGIYGNVTGDHCHSCCGQGHYQGYTTRPSGHQDLTNRIHYWEAVYVNDTVIVQGFNHNWVTWDIPPTPVYTVLFNKFPWVLYSKKFRNRRS